MSRQTGGILTAGLVGALLSGASEAVAEGPVRWSGTQGRRLGVLPVRTCISTVSVGELRMTVNAAAPSEPCLVYLIGGSALRRLCCNVSHRPLNGTHKHRLDPVMRNDDAAYAPHGIPDFPLSQTVVAGVYRAVLRAFAEECFISLPGDDGLWWTEPDLREGW